MKIKSIPILYCRFLLFFPEKTVASLFHHIIYHLNLNSVITCNVTWFCYHDAHVQNHITVSFFENVDTPVEVRKSPTNDSGVVRKKWHYITYCFRVAVHGHVFSVRRSLSQVIKTLRNLRPTSFLDIWYLLHEKISGDGC